MAGGVIASQCLAPLRPELDKRYARRPATGQRGLRLLLEVMRKVGCRSMRTTSDHMSSLQCKVGPKAFGEPSLLTVYQ